MGVRWLFHPDQCDDPNSVTNIGIFAFKDCFGLRNAFFQGNAPSVNGGPGSVDGSVFFGDSGTAYYLPDPRVGIPFGGWLTFLWNPKIQTADHYFGVGTNGFGFNLTGNNPNLPVVVEAGTNLNGVWTPLFTGNIIIGSIYFSDPQWTNYPQRFYRVRSP